MTRPCRHAGCAAILPATGEARYCPRHAQDGARRAAEQVRMYDAARDQRTVEFYRSRSWLRTRQQVLAEQPVCAACERQLASHVDHVVPIQADWSKRLDRSNLQGLCQPCHNAKTARERAARPPSGP